MAKYENIFKQVDMISPWMVGSNISTKESIDSLYSSFIEKHWAWCKANNVDYYPVLFSGFSWHYGMEIQTISQMQCQEMRTELLVPGIQLKQMESHHSI